MENWIYDEFKHCGVDYATDEQAAKYDEEHNKFRDYKKEFGQIMDFISPKNPAELTLIDLGCGTGAVSLYAAKVFKHVYAVDVSKQMLSLAQKKAASQGIKNTDFINAGFLSYRHDTDLADIIATKAAFHHLPDFWKQVALLNMNKMLKPGGLLYIFDIVFGFEPEAYEQKIGSWISEFEKKAGKDFKREVETHIKAEYSTFAWILEGMLEKAGFKAGKKRSRDGFVTEYLCSKQ